MFNSSASVLLFIPEDKLFIYACEGDYELFDEDVQNGYEDYIYYNTYKFENGFFVEENGGSLLLTDSYNNLFPEGFSKELAEYVVDAIFFERPNYIILQGEGRVLTRGEFEHEHDYGDHLDELEF